jgi:hypothetical protein
MVKKILFIFYFFLVGHSIFAQQSTTTNHSKLTSKNAKQQSKLDGQWRGFFGSNGDIVTSGDNNTEYVLEININGSVVSGFSYSYFQNRLYYVICSLAGKYDKTTKTINIVEKERIKGNTPPGWTDCLQMHVLTYKKDDQTEELTGSWKPAPGQIGDCGFGNTTLIRRTLSKDLASYNKPKGYTPFSSPKEITKIPYIANHTKKSPPVKNSTDTKIPEEIATVPAQINTPPVVAEAPKNPVIENSVVSEAPIVSDISYEKRTNQILKTVEIDNETFKVDLYDNGVIDGDSISLFFNGKLILSHKRLSDTAISLILNANTGYEVNELTMYAENLGEIPPNTALMVITDGDSRYEINITSDLQNSGSIRFIHKPKTQ